MVKNNEIERIKAFLDIEGNHITLKEGKEVNLNDFVEILMYGHDSDIDIYKALKGARISLRRGIIILIEEKLQLGIEVDYLNDLESFVKEFYVRFNSAQRKIIFDNLFEIHPPDPCNRYEGKNSWMHQYIISLENILKNSSWLIEDYKVEESLKYIHKEVILCKG